MTYWEKKNLFTFACASRAVWPRVPSAQMEATRLLESKQAGNHWRRFRRNTAGPRWLCKKRFSSLWQLHVSCTGVAWGQLGNEHPFCRALHALTLLCSRLFPVFGRSKGQPSRMLMQSPTTSLSIDFCSQGTKPRSLSNQGEHSVTESHQQLCPLLIHYV